MWFGGVRVPKAIEWRRRRRRRGGVWGGGIPLSSGGGVWGGGCKNFGIFYFEMVHFDAFWRTFRSIVGLIVTVMFMTSAEV